MNIQHPQETVIKTYHYNGITVDLLEWSETLWCGKVGYAANHTDEPDVEKIMEDFYVGLRHTEQPGRELGYLHEYKLSFLRTPQRRDVWISCHNGCSA